MRVIVHRYALCITIAPALLAGCGGSLPTTPSDAGAVSDSGPQSQHLYVANFGGGTITVYAQGQKTPLRAISDGADPFSLAFDRAGNLYAANESGTVTVYAKGKSTLLRTLHVGQGEVFNVALDRQGYVYAPLFPHGSYSSGSVAIFYPDSSKRFATIRNHIYIPTDVAVDPRSGYVFVVNQGNFRKQSYGWISVYAPRSTHATRVITDGFGQGAQPERLAFDSSGNLYSGNTKDITVYAPGSGSVLRTLSGVAYPSGLAFNKSGDLYVANCTNACSESYYFSYVSVYARGATRPKQIITRGVASPYGLTLDDAGSLYVANWSGSTITVYPPRHGVPSETITRGVSLPAGVKFGP